MPHLYLLGGLQAFDGERELASLHAQKIRYAALVFVAAEGETTRDALMGVLWPDREPDRARHTLNQTLYELRKTLGADWVQTTGDRLSLSHRISVDTHLFEQAAQNGDYRAALELYRGDFLAGTYLVESQPFEEWSERQRARLKRLHRKCVREAMREAAERGDAAVALEIASAAAELDPQDDEMQHERIRLVAAAGRPSEALQLFRRYEEVLARDGLKPLDETIQLVQRIRAGESGSPVVTTRVEAAPVPVPDTITPGPLATPAPSPAPAIGWRVLALSTALVTLAFVGFWFFVREPGESKKGSANPRVVVHFTDDSRDGDMGYLANNLTRDLIDALQPLPEVDVLTVNAVAPYRGRPIRADSIARELQATFVITGSVSTDSNRIRTYIELADGPSGKVIGTGKFNYHARGEYYAARDDLVRDAVDLLKQQLGGELRARALRAETNARALELFQQAEDLRDRARQAGSEPAHANALFLRADSLAAEAEARDHDWLRPTVLRARIAYNRAFAAFFIDRTGETTSRLLDSVRIHAERAIASDSSFAPAREIRALVLYRLSGSQLDTAVANRMISQAEADILVAVTSDPRRAEAWSILSQIAHYYRGDFERARHAAQQAYNADAYLETAAEILERLALTSFETGNDAEAKKWCDEGTRRFENDWRFVHCSLLLQGWSSLPHGNPDEARARIDRYALNDPSGAKWNVPFLEMLVAGIYIRAGNLAEARKLMASAGERRSEITNLLWAEAANRTMLGERDSAVALLRAYTQKTPTRSANVLLSRMFTPVREHPDYRELIRFYTPANR